jgi:hypothetical protein
MTMSTTTTTPTATELSTRLVREAPELAAAGELVDVLRADGSPLALAIARIVEYVADGLVDAGIALPALAMACSTLDTSADPAVREAARYEIETLTPMPDGMGAGRVVMPDVPASALTRVRPRRT